MTFAYEYSIEVDLEGYVDTTELTVQIEGSPIVTPLEYIDTHGDVLEICFASELDPAEKNILDGGILGPAGGLLAVNALFAAKQTKLAEINGKTNELVAEGFSYSGKAFPMLTEGYCSLSWQCSFDEKESKPVARCWYSDLWTFKGLIDSLGRFPVYFFNVSETDYISVANLSELEGFLEAAFTATDLVVRGGDLIKKDVIDATTIAQVEAITDPR